MILLWTFMDLNKVCVGKSPDQIWVIKNNPVHYNSFMYVGQMDGVAGCWSDSTPVSLLHNSIFGLFETVPGVNQWI